MPLIRRGADSLSHPAPAAVAPEVALRDSDPEKRWSAARALAGAVDGAQPLGAALQTETDPRVREAILTSLVRIGGPESVGFVLPCLRSSLPEVRTAAMDALRAMIEDVRPVLPRLLADPDPDIRVLSCDLARELPTRDATALMCGVLRGEPEINVCAAAVDVLAEIGEADAAPALRDCAERFGDNPFLSFAIRAALHRLSGGHG